MSVGEVGKPSMSSGLSRSKRKMRPVSKARIRTLLATSAATKSEGRSNLRLTSSTLKMGSEASVRSCRLLDAT